MIGKASNLISKPLQGASSSLVRQLLGFGKFPGMLALAGEVTTLDMYDVEGIERAIDGARTNPDKIHDFEYGLTEGDPLLRSLLADQLKKYGLITGKENIMITSGAQQGIDLISRVLINEGDIVVLPDATYMLAIQTFQIDGAKTISTPTDHFGVIPEKLELILKNNTIKALYVTPNFANPTGATMPVDRRKRLVELAEEYDFVIIEDDSYGAFRYDRSIVPDIYQIAKEMDAQDRITYVSSFSSSVVPSLRLGFLIVSGAIKTACVIMKQILDIHTNSFAQRVLITYLQDGNRFGDQIEKLTAEYKKRCDVLADSLKKYIGDEFVFTKPEGGVFLWGRFKSGVNTLVLLEYAIQEKMVFLPGAVFYCEKPDYSTVRFCFSTIKVEDIPEAIQRFAEALRKYKLEH